MSVPVTAKSAPTSTISGVPEAVRMCDSYTPPELVSVRSMVAPWYFARTAFSTDALVVPVSSFSSERCGCEGSTAV